MFPKPWNKHLHELVLSNLFIVDVPTIVYRFFKMNFIKKIFCRVKYDWRASERTDQPQLSTTQLHRDGLRSITIETPAQAALPSDITASGNRFFLAYSHFVFGPYGARRTCPKTQSSDAKRTFQFARWSRRQSDGLCATKPGGNTLKWSAKRE